MIHHITLFVSDLQKSKEFYSRVLKPLGYKLFKESSSSVGYGVEDVEGNRDFWIKAGNNAEQPHSFSCLAFTASDKNAVENFYKTALEAGGEDNGAPGYRPQYHPGYYAAYILDPDGYNIEAVFDDLSLLQAKI